MERLPSNRELVEDIYAKQQARIAKLEAGLRAISDRAAMPGTCDTCLHLRYTAQNALSVSQCA